MHRIKLGALALLYGMVATQVWADIIPPVGLAGNFNIYAGNDYKTYTVSDKDIFVSSAEGTFGDTTLGSYIISESPIPSLSIAAFSDTPAINGGLPGCSIYLSYDYYFSISGPDAIIPILVTAQGLATEGPKASGLYYDYAYAQLQVSQANGNYGGTSLELIDDLAYVSQAYPSYNTANGSGSEDTGREARFELNDALLTAKTNVLYHVHLATSASGDISGYLGGGEENWHAEVDPTFTIPTSFADAAEYSINFSQGIGDGPWVNSFSSVPEPSTYGLLGVGLLFFVAIKRLRTLHVKSKSLGLVKAVLMCVSSAHLCSAALVPPYTTTEQGSSQEEGLGSYGFESITTTLQPNPQITLLSTGESGAENGSTGSGDNKYTLVYYMEVWGPGSSVKVNIDGLVSVSLERHRDPGVNAFSFATLDVEDQDIPKSTFNGFTLNVGEQQLPETLQDAAYSEQDFHQIVDFPTESLFKITMFAATHTGSDGFQGGGQQTASANVDPLFSIADDVADPEAYSILVSSGIGNLPARGAVAVPEPSTFGIISGISLLLFGALRRRQCIRGSTAALDR